MYVLLLFIHLSPVRSASCLASLKLLQRWDKIDEMENVECVTKIKVESEDLGLWSGFRGCCGFRRQHV